MRKMRKRMIVAIAFCLFATSALWITLQGDTKDCGIADAGQKKTSLLLAGNAEDISAQPFVAERDSVGLKFAHKILGVEEAQAGRGSGRTPTNCSACLGGAANCTQACKRHNPANTGGYCSYPDSRDGTRCCTCESAKSGKPRDIQTEMRIRLSGYTPADIAGGIAPRMRMSVHGLTGPEMDQIRETAPDPNKMCAQGNPSDAEYSRDRGKWIWVCYGEDGGGNDCGSANTPPPSTSMSDDASIFAKLFHKIIPSAFAQSGDVMRWAPGNGEHYPLRNIALDVEKNKQDKNKTGWFGAHPNNPKNPNEGNWQFIQYNGYWIPISAVASNVAIKEAGMEDGMVKVSLPACTGDFAGEAIVNGVSFKGERTGRCEITFVVRKENITPPQTEVVAHMRMKDKDDTPRIWTNTLNLNTVCSVKRCTQNSTCQAVPLISTSHDATECVQECIIDADCSSGGGIEEVQG